MKNKVKWYVGLILVATAITCFANWSQENIKTSTGTDTVYAVANTSTRVWRVASYHAVYDSSASGTIEFSVINSSGVTNLVKSSTLAGNTQHSVGARDFEGQRIHPGESFVVVDGTAVNNTKTLKFEGAPK